MRRIIPVSYTHLETDNYLAASAEVTVTVEKAEAPEIVWPTAGSITYGQSLIESTLTDGSVQYGSFEWAEDVSPDAGTASYKVIFTPSDTENYNWDQMCIRDSPYAELIRKHVLIVQNKRCLHF